MINLWLHNSCKYVPPLLRPSVAVPGSRHYTHFSPNLKPHHTLGIRPNTRTSGWGNFLPTPLPSPQACGGGRSRREGQIVHQSVCVSASLPPDVARSTSPQPLYNHIITVLLHSTYPVSGMAQVAVSYQTIKSTLVLILERVEGGGNLSN